MENAKLIANQIRLLTERLEKLSPDSIWARRASGVRGTLLKQLPELEANILNGDPNKIFINANMEHLQSLIEQGFEFLERAAQEY